jgi:hypothetical protein
MSSYHIIKKEGLKMRARKDMVLMGTKVGAAIGVLAYLIFGIMPGFFFGSYGSLLVMSHLMGGVPVEPSMLVRVAVAVGVLMGEVCLASVSIVIGAISGTAIGYLVESVSAPAGVKEAEEAVAKTK